jgi:predicted permease
MHSFWRLRHVDLGHQGEDLLTMEVNSLGPAGRDRARIAVFERRLLERVRALPGVVDASATTSVPFRGVDFLRIVAPVGGGKTAAHERSVDARYFEMMRIPVIAGRGFTEQDSADSQPVAIVSESYGRLAFDGRSPLGERLDLDETKPVIVGVVGDVRHKSAKEAPAPAYYLPRTQDPTMVVCLVVRTTLDRAATAAGIRRVVQDLAPTQPVERITTLGDIVDEAIAGDRFYSVTTGAFGGIALLLAVAGLMGVVRRGVTERTRELAIRAALGADSRLLVRRTIAQELAPVLAGAVLGLMGAFWLSRLLQRFLFEVSPLDPWAYGAASLLLVAAAFVGCYIPARRITRIDPATALRAE